MDSHLVGLVGGIAGGVLGVMGGIVGTFFGIRNTNGPKERAFAIRAAAVCWLGVSELMKESDRGFQIANGEFINAFEIRLSIHSQFAMCHPESIPSHPLSLPGLPLPAAPTLGYAPLARLSAITVLVWPVGE